MELSAAPYKPVFAGWSSRLLVAGFMVRYNIPVDMLYVPTHMHQQGRSSRLYYSNVGFSRAWNS